MLVLGPLHVDVARRVAVGPHAEVRLTEREAALLGYLAERAGRTVSRAELLTEVWGFAPTVESRAVDFTMARLRTKVEEDPAAPRWLLTVAGVGYRLVTNTEPVAAIVPPAPSARRVLPLGDRTVDLDAAVVLRGESRTPLSPNECALLAWLAGKPGQVVSRAELLREVWRARTASRSVDAAVDRLRAKIEEDPHRPRRLVSVSGRGLRLDLPRSNLPPEHTRFVGRVADVQGIVARLEGGDRLVTLLGPAGIGKTRLARQAARAFDGVGAWFVDLSDARDPVTVERTVADALGVPLPATRPPGAILGQALGALGPAVLVLDNFEQIVAYAEVTVGQWRRSAPELRVLVTSREPLQLDGERVVELPTLDEADAVALLLDRVPGADPALGAEIVRRLDGLPLAIELAAARLPTLGARAVLTRLDQRLDLLVGQRRDASARQATLRGAIGWSWDLLTPEDRAAFAAFSVFSGGFSLEAAAAVVPDALARVEALRARSLLRAWEPAGRSGELRFGMLESIRAYAAERLADVADAAIVRANARAWIVTRACVLVDELDGSDPDGALDQLQIERDNLLAVLAEGGDVERVHAAIALEELFTDRGPVDLHARVLDVGVAATGAPPGLRARIHVHRADLRRSRSTFEDAEQDARAALALADTPASEAHAERCLGKVLKDQGRIADAERRVRSALAGADLHGSVSLRAYCRTTLGILLAQSGRFEEAESTFLEGLRIADQGGVVRARRGLLSNLADVYLETGRYGAAEDIHVQVLHDPSTRPDSTRWAGAQEALGRLALEQGDLDRAEAAIVAANRVFHRNGDLTREAYGDARLGLAAMELGDRTRAATLFERARRTFRLIHGHRGEGMSTANLGILAHMEGRAAAGAALLAAAADRFASVDDTRMTAMVRTFQASATADAGDPDEALRVIASVGPLLERTPMELASTLVEFARLHVALARGEPDARARAEARLADPASTASQDLRFAAVLLRSRCHSTAISSTS